MKRLQGTGVGAVLLRGASGAFIVRVIGVGLMFVTHMILARALGASSYGNFVYAMTWLTILSLFGILGLDNASLRFVAEYNGTRKWGMLKGFVERSGQFSLVMSVFVALSAAGVLWLIRDKIELELATSLWVAFMILPLYSLLEIRVAGLRALKHVAKSQFAGQILRPFVFLCGLGVIYFVSGEVLNASTAMAINLVGFAAALLFVVVLFNKALSKDAVDSVPEYMTKTWTRVALPMLLMNAMLQTENQADIIIIGFFLDSDQIGIYAAAKKISLLVAFGYYAVNAIAAPMIAEMWHQDRKKELQRMLTLAAWGISAFTLPVSLIMIIFGKQILGLFGPEFTAAYWPLVILSGGQIINSMVGSVGALMIMTGHQKNALIIIAVSMVSNIALSLLLIPAFAIIGAAIAMSMSLIIWNILMFVYVIKNIGLDPSIFKLKLRR